jgi:hypothetical protein
MSTRQVIPETGSTYCKQAELSITGAHPTERGYIPRLGVVYTPIIPGTCEAEVGGSWSEAGL